MADFEVSDEGQPVARTQESLIAEMKAAVDSGDWKAVIKISTAIAKVVAGEEKAEKDAKLAVLVGTTADVKAVIDKAVDKFISNLPSEILTAMDGIWYSQDFGESLTSCRVSKGAARKASGTGGGAPGKKLNITTNELLAQVGEHVIEGGNLAGQTFKAAYESSTDGNFRYKLRLKMAKVAGL